MAKELNATVLPLSVTYRCPKSVVAVANGVVADLQAAPSAPAGTVTSVQDAQLRSGAKAGDFVLSRKNAPLMSLCLGFLSQGIPAVIAGRDVAKTLGTLIAKSKAKTVEALITWVGAYRTKEMDRLGRLDPERAEKKIQEANDKCDCIIALTEGCDTIGDITKRLETMFADNDPTAKVVLSTVHKAKGLERNRVWVLTDTFRPKKSEEEANLWYVAVTRSKSELYLVAKAD